MYSSVLIDADILVYRAAITNQVDVDWDGDGQLDPIADFDQALHYMGSTVASWMEEVDHIEESKWIYCITTGDNWRYNVLPSYKANRKDVVPPVLRKKINQYLLNSGLPVAHLNGFEADDVMGILSTTIPGRFLIISQDKDLLSIPGWIWNPDKLDEPVWRTEEDADFFHYFQTLTGDAVDNYKGCPGIGPKKAYQAFSGLDGSHEAYWSTIVDLYESKGLTEEDALVQARVARICRNTEFNTETREVKLWTPPVLQQAP